MTTNTVMTFEERVKKAAKILNQTPKSIKEALKEGGIDDIELLDAFTTTHGDLQGVLLNHEGIGEIPTIKLKAGVGILKGEDPFKKPLMESQVPPEKADTSSLAELIKSYKPVTQWSDEEVLTKYIETDNDEYESDLQRRAKNRPFIILKEGSQEEVDVEASLVMLKKARKENIPSFVTGTDKKVIHIHKVEEYHVANRVRYESPLRPGVMLFDGFCQVSNQNFKNVGDPARKMLRLIYTDVGEQSRMDETRLVEIAETEGVDGLARIYPEIHDNYMKLATTDSLPSLKTIAPVETRQADPFYQKQNGNQTF